MAKRKGKKKLKYSSTFEKFYKENKRKIIDGLKDDVPKNQIKKIFYYSMKEEQYSNPGMSQKRALKKVLRSRTFSTEEENFEYYREEVFKNVFKGMRKEIKEYLGIPYRDKLDLTKFRKTNEGWSYSVNGKTVLFLRNPDTKIEGYNVLYE